MADTRSNNPPAVSLELTQEQAQFLMDNCDANLRIGIGAVMTCTTREQAEPWINLNEQFHAIRRKLIAQGIESK